MQKKCFSRAARAENARHAKLVRDLAKEFGKDATWQLAAMDALRKANPDELELMHGLTAAKTLEFVDALIQFKSRSGNYGRSSPDWRWRSVREACTVVVGRLYLHAFRASSSSFWSCGLIHHVTPDRYYHVVQPRRLAWAWGARPELVS